MLDVVIIGCGIVGAAAAYELSRYDLTVAVTERENDVAMGATKANSAVIHAGYDPWPGTLMARLNVEGAQLATQLFKKLDIPYRQCGSFVLAFSKKEIEDLDRQLDKARKNSVPDVSILPGDELLKMEPNLSKDVVAALYAPTTMIVDPWEYTLALAETSVRNGVQIYLERAVSGIERIRDGYRLHTTGGDMETRRVLNAAGVYSDVIHNMVSKPAFKIQPAKGEYCLLDKSEGARVNSVIFQCPSRSGKGVLVLPTVHGNLIVGPSSESPTSMDDVATTADGLDFVFETARKSVPGIDFGAKIRSFSGIRARSDRRDFIIEEAEPGFFDLAGIKSPGLSASPAIAKMAVRLMKNSGLVLIEKREFFDSRKRIRSRGLTKDEKSDLVRSDPSYGRVVCRCETVTEGEVRDALNGPLPPRSIDAVKRRCGAGMGRCQGGFCGPRVLEILAKHYQLDPVEVLQDREGTNVLVSETKTANALY